MTLPDQSDSRPIYMGDYLVTFKDTRPASGIVGGRFLYADQIIVSAMTAAEAAKARSWRDHGRRTRAGRRAAP